MDTRKRKATTIVERRRKCSLLLGAAIGLALTIPLVSPAQGDVWCIPDGSIDVSCTQPWPNFAQAVNGAVGGDTILVGAGTFPTAVQIVINKNLTIKGKGAGSTTITAGFDTGTSGDPRGWFLVNNNATLSLSKLTLDGSGHKIWNGIRFSAGGGTIDQCAFANIQYEASGPSYSGVAMAAYTPGLPVDVTNSTFAQIGRVGILYFGNAPSTFSGNTYTGKGTGDFLDYALDIDAGAVVTVSNNTVSGNRGVASVDNSTSAGFLVTTYYDHAGNHPGSGTQVTFTGNDISNSTSGIAIGYDDTDTSVVTASCNQIHGNDEGMSVIGAAGSPIAATNNSIAGNTSFGIDAAGVVSGAVSAAGNWWGCALGANTSGCDTVSANVSVGSPLTAQPQCAGCAGANTDGAACNDNNACTQTDTCQSGSCIGSNPKVCTALDQCHNAGTCAPATGACSNPNKTNGTPCNDGNACTPNDICSFGVCAGAPSSHMNCDDNNPCTDDSCSPTGGCVHINNTASCNDRNACTVGDKCSGGGCVAGSGALSCDDANPCTADFCSAPSGCAHTNVGDGTQCTSSTGAAGTCATGSCCIPALAGTAGVPASLLTAIEQQCPSCPRNATTHTKYVKCVKSMTKVARANKVITTKQQNAINKVAQQAH